MQNVYIEMYGCSANISDAEIMAGLLKKNGFTIVKTPKQSDVNIICTCDVKLPTQHKMIHRVKKLTRMKKPLIVAGCMPKNRKEIIENINPKAVLIGPYSIEKITKAVRCALKGEKCIFLDDSNKPKLCIPRVRKNPIIGIVQISRGCLSSCSYCSVRFARGRLISYPPELVKRDIENTIKEGCKEIWLTSQDNACYGMDIGTNLPRLLETVCNIKGDFLIRIGMMNPLFLKKILNELINVYSNKKIFKFLHIPVQSGSDKILRLMRRDYTVKNFKKIVSNFRKEIPDITIWTDIIVGFPGETNIDFKKSLKLIETIKPDFVNISKYGIRIGTDAVKMKQLPVETIKERCKIITELVDEIAIERNEKWIGWSGSILIDEFNEKKGTWIGRNFAYKPVVIKSHVNMGDIVRVKIVSVKKSHLIGKKIE